MPMRYTDSEIVEFWLQSQPSPLTQDCYRRDVRKLVQFARKPLRDIGVGDLQRFSKSLTKAGLAPVSRMRTVATAKSFCGFCQRLRYIPVSPAAELPLPRYEVRLAQRILQEEAVQRVLRADMAFRTKNPLLRRLAGL